MKYFLIILLYLPSIAQNPPDTEIFLYDLKISIDSVEIKKGRNISNNPGYDNQPSFFSDDLLLYARTRNGQTDIAGYDTKNLKNSWFSHTTVGSEYSPKRIPNSNNIAAVRLDTTGLQRLYIYNRESGRSSVLVPDLKVGYFAFLDSAKIITSVLTNSGMDLVLNDLEKQTTRNLVTNAGRSLHNVPGTESMSYTVINEEKNIDLYLLDLKEGEPSSFFITSLPPGVQDYTWLDRDRILLGNGSKLFLYNILGSTEWTVIADISDMGIKNITRLAVNKKVTHLVIAAETDMAAD